MVGKTLYNLTDRELKEDLGITVLGNRKTLIEAIQLHKNYYLKLKTGGLLKIQNKKPDSDQKG